ncbi:MAG: cytochrome c biogenesis protein CcdA [Phormidesmis sp.]
MLTLFPRVSHQLFSALSIKRWIKVPKRIGLSGEFWLGTQLGLLWMPCAEPVLGSILVLAAVDQQAKNAFELLFLYGMGAAVPMLLFAYGGRYLSRRLLSLRDRSAQLQQIGGAMVVGTAVAILLGWDIRIQLWLAPLFPALPL